MNEPEDSELLRRWATRRDEAAFARLRLRYANLIYYVCLREVRDRTLAEDAAPAVFVLLARKAAPLSRRSGPLAGWLFSAARLVGRNAARHNARRQAREVSGAWVDMALVEQPDDAAGSNSQQSWSAMDERLNDALARLSARDRNAVLLRFFDQRSFAELGSALGIAENAARMRVSRAVEKLRRHLAKAGVVVSLAALTVFLTERASDAAPSSLSIPAIAVTNDLIGASSGGVSMVTSPLLKGTGILLMATTYKTGIVATVAALGLIALLGAGGGAVVLAKQHAGPARLTERVRRAVLSPLVGEWAGELQYRDYQSERLVKTPARMAVAMSPQGDALSVRITYPRFRSRVEVSTWSLSAQTGVWTNKDNKQSEENAVAGMDAFAATGRGILTLTARGIDGIRPSEIRTTINRTGDSLSVRREARPIGGVNRKAVFAFRNQYTLRRVESSSVSP